MHERRRWEHGDITGQTQGDLSAEPGTGFTDWDNPEDWDEPADGEVEDEIVPEPGDPDYDLTEEAGYAGWDEPQRGLLPRWLIVAISILLVLAMLTPLLIRLS